MKSNSAAKKRFKKTASGGFKRKKAFASHILTKKSAKRKRNLRQATMIHETDQKSVEKLLPYA